jgi:hypothetical protein
MLVPVDDPMAWAVLTASSALLLVAAFPLRTRLQPRVVDALLAISGAGIAVGGLLFLDDVGVASWVFAPVFLAIGAIAHVRALFAGAGPFRS